MDSGNHRTSFEDLSNWLQKFLFLLLLEKFYLKLTFFPAVKKKFPKSR